MTKVEVDKTVHNPEVHTTPGIHIAANGTFLNIKRSRSWYAFWGNKCPTCQAPAQFQIVKGK